LLSQVRHRSGGQAITFQEEDVDGCLQRTIDGMDYGLFGTSSGLPPRDAHGYWLGLNCGFLMSKETEARSGRPWGSGERLMREALHMGPMEGHANSGPFQWDAVDLVAGRLLSGGDARGAPRDRPACEHSSDSRGAHGAGPFSQ